MVAVEVDVSALLVRRTGYRNGWPCLRGTGISAHSVAAAHLAGLTFEQICAENPDLDAGLFHAALAYYFANRERVEGELEADRQHGERLASMSNA